MQSSDTILEPTDAPSDRSREVLDVRSLGPPEPLAKTLETLADRSDDTVLIQRNDRVPQFLYPKLENRGYAYETVEHDDEVVTVIWAE